MSQAPQGEMATLEIWKGADEELRVGGLRFVACRREVDTIDGGVTLYAWDDPSQGEARELLRLDLFRERPHYHAPAENQQETRISGHEGDSLAWGIQALTTRAGELLREGDFASVAETLDPAALADAGPALRALFERLGEPTERSTFDVPAATLAALGRG